MKLFLLACIAVFGLGYFSMQYVDACVASATDPNCSVNCAVSAPSGGRVECSGTACEAICKSYTPTNELHEEDRSKCHSGCPSSSGGGGNDDDNDGDGGSFDCYPFTLDCYPAL